MTWRSASCSPSQVPLLAHAAGEVGDNQVRHRGTIGGSISHADPASDLRPRSLALDATFVVQGPDGAAGGCRRRSSSRASSSRTSSPTELLTEIRVPKTRWRRLELPEVQPPGPGLGHRRCRRWRNGSSSGIGLVNMGVTPLRATAVEQALAQGASITDAAELAAEGTEPPTDLNASPRVPRATSPRCSRSAPALERCSN